MAINYDAYQGAIEGRLEQNAVPVVVEGLATGAFNFSTGNVVLTDEFIVDENLDTFSEFLIDEFLTVLADGRAGGLVPLAEGTLDTEVSTKDENGDDITFNNKQKLLEDAGSLIKTILEKDEADLTVDDYRNLVGHFSYYLQFLTFDKETNGSLNPNAVPTAGTFILECAKDLENTIGNIFKQAFVDFSVYTYFENGEVTPGSEIKVRAMIPSRFVEALERITDSCTGSFLGQDPTPTKSVTETKTPKQMEKLTALLDSTTRDIMGTNITKDDVGKPNPEGGVYVLNDMKNIVVGTYEVEPTPYVIVDDKITYELSDPVMVEANWSGIK